MSKFQLCTSSGFGIISKSITFQTKNRRFFCSFESQFTITWPRIPKIGTHDTFNNSYAEATFELFRFYRLLVIKQIKHRMPKFANKTNGKVQIKSQLKLPRSLNYWILNFYWKQNKISEFLNTQFPLKTKQISSNKIAPLKLIAIDQFKSYTTATQAKYWCTILAKLLTKLISRTPELLESWNYQNSRMGKYTYFF